MIARPDFEQLSQSHRPYAEAVPPGDVLAHLARQGEATERLFAGLDAATLDRAYAPGKWTPRQILGHLIDGEWVFSYRALRFSRNEPERLSSMDEQAMMEGSCYATRAVDSLLEEYRHLRRATLALFGGMTPAQLERVGQASTYRLTPAALAYVIAGHEAHHMAVLRERYL